jgi:hypothetical protein
MRHPAFLCGSILCGLLLGCSPPQAPPQPAAAPEPVRPPEAEDRRPANRLFLANVRIAVIELPVGAATEKPDLWQGLDENQLQADRAIVLYRNGLRVGTTQAENNAMLAKMFRNLTGRQPYYGLLSTMPGVPMTLTLKQDQPPWTVFTIDPDGRTRGADYPAGNYVLAVSCRLNEDDPSKVLLTVVPQIRSRFLKTPMDLLNQDAATRSDWKIFGFEQVSFALTLPAGDIVVIGPSKEARRSSSIGHGFLIGSKDGVPFETVLVLIPEVASGTLP